MKNLIANNKPPGKGKKVIANYSKILLIILGLLVQTSTFGADTWIDPAGDNNITIDSPSFRLQFRYYMDDGADSFWDSAPSLYINDQLIWTINELNIEGETRAHEIRDYNQDWISYEHNDYYIVLYDPYDRGDNKLWVNMEILPKRMKPGTTYKVQIKGNWCPNRNWDPAEYVTIDCPFTPKVPENIIDRMGSFSRPAEGIIRYNQSNITPYKDNGFTWEFGFYKSSSYSETNRYARLALPDDANSTGNHIQWGGNSNNLATTVYTKTYLIRRNQPYGANSTKKTGEVYFYKEYGKTDVNGYIRANHLYTQPDMWNKSITLTWENKKDYENAVSAGNWLVWRYTKSQGESSKKIIATLALSNKKFTDSEELIYDTEYGYFVSFKPNDWNDNDFANDLSSSDNEKIVRNYRIDLATVEHDNHVLIKYGGEEIKGKENFTYILSRKKVQDTQWTEIITNNVNNKRNVYFEYEDFQIENACDNYEYRASIEMMDTVFYSNISSGKLLGTTRIINVHTTKGTYSNAVKLTWEVEQIGSAATLFNVYRRLLNDNKNDSWKEIYSTSGTNNKYTFEDVTVKPGQYYEYKVTYSYPCDGLRSEAQAERAEGFCLSSGVIAGKLSYATGTAAEGVKVGVQHTDEEGKEIKVLFSSLKVDNGAGVKCETAAESENKIFFGHKKDFSVQMWVCIDEHLNESDDALDYSDKTFFETNGGFGLFADRDEDGKYKMAFIHPDTSGNPMTTVTDIVVDPDTYYHYTLSHIHSQGLWKLTVIGPDEQIMDASITAGTVANQKDQSIIFGRRFTDESTYFMRGFMDEIRWWNKALTEKEILKNYGHPLSGTEAGLLLYYPFDENIPNPRTAYDYSKTSDVANESHGEILIGAQPSDKVPSIEQFSLYAITDEFGNYTLRGVPITSEGVNYYITPTKGVHRFTPERTTRFISANSLIHDNVDFTDTSSFPVSGKVYYKNTLHPVSGVTIKVDGEITMSSEGEISVTDENGEFTISVPVGDHYISLEKEGHSFENDGFYPARVNGEIQTMNFDREIKNLTFNDMTTAVVVGRVSGGKVEHGKALGFGIGKANIGKAVIQLTTGYDMNMITDPNTGDYSYNPDTLFYGLASDSVQHCKAYAGTTNEDGVRTITIETDPENGEFAVLLPPAEYKVTYATIPATGYKFEDLPNINVRVGKEFLKTDSILNDTTFKYFNYHTSLKLNQRNNCVLEVSDQGTNCAAFGEEFWANPKKSKEYHTSKDSVTIFTVAKNGDITYQYNYPIYFQLGDYKLDLYSYEQYVNMDDPKNPQYDKVPNKEALVTINNEFGDGVVVGKDGTILQKSEREVVLDNLGRGTYHFKGGLPNIQGDYTLSMNISYEVDGNTLAWSENGKFKAILLGALPTGNNFVTKGPDKVLGILRDPPGSNSYTRWEKGHTITNGWKTFGEWGIGLDIKTVTSFGPVMSSATGFIGAYVVNKLEAKFKLTVASEGTYSGNCDNTVTSKVTLSEAISTSNSDSYVGGMADVFVGTGTNMTFGEARAVDFIMNADSSSCTLGLKETMTMGEEFTTSFQYTQSYIETNVIPNLKKLRNAKLLPQGTPETNNTNGFIYISKLEETNPLYGSSNYDKNIWRENAVVWNSNDLNKSYDGPSYKIIPPKNSTLNQKNEIDSIQFYNNDIDGWIYELRRNDSIKVAAINGEPYSMDSENESVKEMLEKYPGLATRNISFDGGTTYEGSWQIVNDTLKNETHKGHIGFILGGEFGSNINGVGTLWDIIFTPSGGGGTTDTDGDTGTETTKFVLADNGFDAFSVDIYNRINEQSPIFYTQGGKSRCPYEGEVVAKYYEPEKHHVLSKATQKIEYPRITCDESMKMGVPSEEAAYFTIKLRNFSETNTPMWYDLSLVEGSNPDGLEISMDGGPVEGSFFINGGDSIVKTVTMRQGNPSVRRYDNIRLRLASQCQNNPASSFGEIADTVSLSVEFVPACSDIRLEIPNPILNKQTEGNLPMTVDRYDLNRQSLNGIEIQMKGISDTIWTTIKKYVTKADLVEDGVEYLDKNSNEGNATMIEYEFDMSNNALYPDGEYLFRAITICNFGDGNVNNESEEIRVVKDMVSPTIIATPSPSDGILQPGDEIAIVFNENILASSINDNKIKVEGFLNDAEIEHQTALKCDGKNSASTETVINVSQQSFATNLWMNYTQPGTILRHGTDNQSFEVSITDEHHLNIRINDKSITSEATLPTDQWIFVSISYSCDKEDECRVNADIAYGEENVNLFDNEPICEYSGNGRLTIGAGLVGSIHEVTLWNYARTAEEAFSNMYTTKRPQTAGLVGYWKLNEGRGKVASDTARNRHLILQDANGWTINNFNSALQLADGQIGVIDISGCTTSKDENYMIEFWFKGEPQSATASIMSVGDGLIDIRQDGNNIELAYANKVYPLTTTSCLDNQWHHLALNVLKNGMGSVIVYLDGTAIKQLSAKDFPALAANHIYLGAKRDIIAGDETTYQHVYSQPFKGYFDEFRYWKGHLTSELIRQNMYHRIKDNAIAMQAYYPFEKTMIDSYHQTVYVPSLNNHCGEDRPDFKLMNMDGTVLNITDNSWSTTDCPPMTTAPKKENISYSYVVSERKLLIHLEEDPARLEGNFITIKVSGLRDMNNNPSEDIIWNAYVQQNPLSWNRNEVHLTKEKDKMAQFTTIISNNGGETEYWGITHLPSWLEADVNAGSLEPNGTQRVTFTVPASAPVGYFEETIYLKNQNHLSTPLIVQLASGGDLPDWDVNPNDFESSMSLIGQLILDGRNSENTNNIIAAFNGNTCVGIAHPEYIKRFDSYYVLMNIYGSSQDSTSSITFKVYDANTGVIYPSIKCSEPFKYAADKIVGSMEKPAQLTIDNKMEQRIELRKGWKWVTLNVQPDNKNLKHLMRDAQGKVELIKTKAQSATFYLGDIWLGELQTLQGNKMYKFHSRENFTHSVVGTPLTDEEATVELEKGWNWIGYTPTTAMSVSDAFSGANPQEGDVVKSQYAFSVFTDYEWIGTLEGMTPGEGYVYHTQHERTFSYPQATVRKRNMPTFNGNESDATFTYASNMNVIATVMNGEEVVSDVNIYVYANDTLLGSSTRTISNDLHFLTIQGEEQGKKMSVVVEQDGVNIDVSEHLYFNDNAVLGTPAQPYVIQLDERAAMQSIMMEQDDRFITITATQPLSHVSMYNTKGQMVHHYSEQGSSIRIPTSSLSQGAYIISAKTTNGTQRTFKMVK